MKHCMLIGLRWIFYTRANSSSIFIEILSWDLVRGLVLGPDVPQHGAGGPDGPGGPVPG